MCASTATTSATRRRPSFASLAISANAGVVVASPGRLALLALAACHTTALDRPLGTHDYVCLLLALPYGIGTKDKTGGQDEG